MLATLLTTGFFAVTAVFARRAALMLGPTAANFWRLSLATIVLGTWTALAGRGLGVGWGWFFLGGVAGFGLGGLAMFHSLPRAGSNLSTLTVQCGAVVVALFGEWLWLGTAPTPQQLGCIAAILAGVLLGLAPRGLPQFEPRQLKIGATLAALSACGQGLGQVLSRKAFAVARVQGEGLDPATTAFERVVPGLLVAAVALAVVRVLRARRAVPAGGRRVVPAEGRQCDEGEPSASRGPALAQTRATEAPGGSATDVTAVFDGHSPSSAPASTRFPGPLDRAWPWVVLNTLTGPVFGVVCLQWALRSTPAGVVQAVVAVAPLLTAPMAWRLGETVPRPRYFVGAGLAVAATVALFRPEMLRWVAMR